MPLLIKEADVTEVPSNTRLIIKENDYCIVLEGTVIVKEAQTVIKMGERSMFKVKGLTYSGEEGCKIIIFGKEQLPDSIRQKILHTSIKETQSETGKEPQSDLSMLLFDKKVCCPLCNTTFTARQVRYSKLKSAKQDPDLRMHFVQMDPILYNVFICPQCGYANLSQDFEKMAPVKGPLSFSTEEERDNSSQLIGPELAIKNYKLVLRCLKELKSTPDKLARIYLYLAWLYEDTGSETLAKEMRNDALTYYKQAYSSSSDPNSSQIHQIAYLIAELSSQLGNKKDAYDFFQRLIREKDAAPWLVKQARERLYVLREKA